MSVPSLDEIRRTRFVVVVVLRVVAVLVAAGAAATLAALLFTASRADIDASRTVVFGTIAWGVAAAALWFYAESLAVRIVPTWPIRTSTDPIGERGGAKDGAGEGG